MEGSNPVGQILGGSGPADPCDPCGVDACTDISGDSLDREHQMRVESSKIMPFLPRNALQCKLKSAVLRSHVVRPSVTLVICDHIGWKSWKLIARTISLTSSLFATKRRSTYSQGNMGKFGETRGGVGKKWHAGEQKRQYL